MRKISTTSTGKKRVKHLTNYSINALFQKVVKVRMFNKIWINGQDGNFYQIDSEKEIILAEEHKYIGTVRPLKYVYQNLQTGYDLNGNRVCYRKHPYAKHKEPVIWCKTYRKIF
ncbi:hypothetical protein JF75_05300 [Lactobacillus kimbladii]|uniref:Uncharacterized protein n=1 Tax=Lactobacillus kimbladii TaxID=1218506 RepID=A0A0F4LLH4_9LACO|nr:hypothetical protein [Lactobacillus kimbladii]KJY59129.1 hypothetical protein JF75_05300 [Lactobacillus kimbladii]